MVEHASEDDEFASHPALLELGVESYVGVPIVRRSGEVFGTLCALDTQPGEIDPEVIGTLEILAKLISLELEERESHEQTREELSEATLERDARDRLIGILGHDLRTPLAASRLAAQLIKVTDEPEEIARLAGEIEQSTERMERMIRDLLDLSRVGMGGGIPVSLGEGSIHRVVEYVVGEITRAHPSREIKLNLPDQTDPSREWDHDRMAQVVSNLVSNALAYSPEDSTVEVTLEVSDEEVAIEVVNDGEIDPEVVPNLFEPFKRGGESGSGLGLGLFIAGQIVDAHGGEITVTTSDGKVRFRCTFPVE